MTVDGTIEKLLRLLHGQLIIRAQQDWSYADVASSLLCCGLTEFGKFDENVQWAYLQSLREERVIPDAENSAECIIK